MTDLTLVAEALEAAKWGRVSEGGMHFAILTKLAEYFRTIELEACDCGACPGFHGTEWAWLVERQAT